ncbi:hypothetical protein [Ferruginibacter sp.]
MNSVTTYETLIAAKLEQLPIPDMADSIWASIEMQLDAPVEGSNQQTRPKPGGKTWIGFTCVVVVVALLWIYYHKKTKTPVKNEPPAVTPQPTLPKPLDSTYVLPPQQKTNPPLPTPGDIKKADSIPELSGNRDRFIPALSQDNDRTIKPDSLLLDKPLSPVPDSLPVNPGNKKPKGVKGITNDDYRIYGNKKDSGKKGG